MNQDLIFLMMKNQLRSECPKYWTQQKKLNNTIYYLFTCTHIGCATWIKNFIEFYWIFLFYLLLTGMPSGAIDRV
jgi:hypothetical protein